MTIVVLENVPLSLRGELSKWLIEIQTNVFVGKVSKLVRDKLWEMVKEKVRDGNSTLVYNADNEQGFLFETYGPTRRVPVNLDGLSLVHILTNS